MPVKTTRRPAFSEQQAAGLAQELYGIEGSVRELPSYQDQNFHLVAGPGQEFTLKIARADESEALLRLQNRALERLCQEHCKARFPRLCPAADGCDLTPVPSPDGRQHWVRLLTYLPGVPLARYRPHSPRLLHRIGGVLGRMDHLLSDLASESNRQDCGWDLRLAVPTVRRHLWEIEGAQRRELVEHFLSRFEAQSVPAFESLRSSLIHNDVNDYNLLVDLDDGQEVLGLIDFGDLLCSFTVSELAIACAYAILDKPDPIEAACHLVAGYHQAFPLTELEIELLLPFICMRLCTSVALSAHQQENEPDNQYLGISQRPAWAMLKRLRDEVHPRLAHYRLRQACGLMPCPAGAALASRLQQLRGEGEFAPVVEPDLRSALVFDLSIGSPELGTLGSAENLEAFSRKLCRRLEDCGASVGVGRYDEVRGLYRSSVFQAPGNERKVWRSVHLGIDLFLEAGSPVFAPLQGTVHSLQDNDALLDYGPTVILQHRIEGLEFFTLYGHLGSECLQVLQPGQTIFRGGRIGSIGDFPSNGNWPPHLHFQIIADLLDREGEFPGVASPGQREVWLSLSPDPNLMVGIPEKHFPPDGPGRAAILQARRRWLGPSLSLSYRRPLQIVRGFAQYLYDEQGQPYLDCVNNVCHVGHSHPRVVEAASAQAAVLNTNTRYLHPRIAEYAERLTATLPDPLEVCFFVCTGSEANDLALRLARTQTGRRDILVLDGAYHGNLTSLVELSPCKFDGPGGSGAPSYVHKLAMPDPYRGACKLSGPQAGRRCADEVAARIRELQEQGREPAAFIAEPVLGCGGQVVLPEGYLAQAFEHVRRAGGVCIADEVQVGFGRVGTHFW
ncbi:MAG: aminotransferase class III-fold pyridoxal phosphate-dependent enzyme, partial [Acidobacteriota bacterium]